MLRLQILKLGRRFNCIAPFCKILFGSIMLLPSSFALAEPLAPSTYFKENTAWTLTTKASAIGKSLQLGDVARGDILALQNTTAEATLTSNGYFGDLVMSMNFLMPQDSRAQLYVQGRYAIELHDINNEWQSLSLKFRAPRFDEARNKMEDALLLEVLINGERVLHNELRPTISNNAPMSWEDQGGPQIIKVTQGSFALRNFALAPADFNQIKLPKTSGEKTNEQDLVDFVALGKETFESLGCNACHLTNPNSSGVSTGPNLYGLFKREARDREVIEGGKGHRFTIKADSRYLHRSLRAATEQLAIAESGSKKGEAYLPLMPVFSPQVISDAQIDAVGDYLATLNTPWEQGPAIKLLPQAGAAEYDPVADRLQQLVDDEVRIQRGPMQGVSGRAIHVGTPWGVNYSFDPRLLAITKIWQGGFLDMSGEFLNRGGKGLKMGYESREINFGELEYLFAPLNAQGELIDFSFKDAKFGDPATAKASLYSQEDHLSRLKKIGAQFLGYRRDSTQKNQLPTFRYSIGTNKLEVRTTIDAKGTVIIALNGKLNTAQAFSLNTKLLQNIKTKVGQLNVDRWSLPAGKINTILTAQMLVSDKVWHAPKSNFDYRQQPIKITPAKAKMPAGYSIESYYPPKDNFGREQLFEALGLALTQDNTTVIATRTAGIWRMHKGQWKLFAEGTFDSLGLLVEDKKGFTIIAGQKAELTRISDTNGDGIADNYDTLFDAHSYHGNYHSYMHGPVRGADGAYYISINLADGGDGSTYKAGGAYMGSAGGYAGWNIRITPKGEFTPWANGLRSPAGLGLGPDGRLWYSDNQGEYMGTSKIFVIEKDKFYGHPSSLVDLPGMTPDSAEIQWDKVKTKRTQPIILLPHNRVANSPGNPAWDTTAGKFGAFAGQMLMGDQTQSNLLRIATQTVDGIEQGSVMPFIDDLESGVMRPLFLADGSLLLGQTGRGWQAKGGHVASLQRIRWDGKTIAPAIKEMLATATGFRLELTQPLAQNISREKLAELIKLESWVYRDAPDYGSEEMGLQQEQFKKISLNATRTSISIELVSLQQAKIHPEQTARIYHAQLQAAAAFNDPVAATMDAYYTLYKFPTQ